VLNEKMEAVKGDLIDPVSGEIIESSGIQAKGITGTGVISTIALAIKEGLTKKLPHLPDGRIILGEGIIITDKDVEEVGKAIGAIWAAHMTLMIEAGIEYSDLKYVYMSGATGTYVNAEKARHIGSVPGFVSNIVQFGNTSIGLARKLAVDPIKLCDVMSMANKIHADHLMMATSETFKDIYVCELSYWQQGMPQEIYDQMLELYHIKPFPANLEKVHVERRVSKDIDDVGKQGLDIVQDIGITLEAPVEKCILCHKCEKECPEDAVIIIEREGKRFANIDSQHCLGTSCRRCVAICPEQTMNHSILKIKHFLKIKR